MKLKPLYLLIIALLVCQTKAVLAMDIGLRLMARTGIVRCGTDLQAKSYAYQDKEKVWYGIDADLCRVFSAAVFGDPEHFKLVHVEARNVAAALAQNKIDIMLGNVTVSAKYEVSQPIRSVDILYYEKQMFLAREIPGASSMEAYRGKKVCAVANSADLRNFEAYNRKYALEIQPILFHNLQKSKEAFLLRRCDLFSGNEIYLRSMLPSLLRDKQNVSLLPEVIAYKPVYAFVSSDNPSWSLSAKWILNAIKLAEAQNMNSKNMETFIGISDMSGRNVLGIDPALWKAFGLQPEWLKTAVTNVGNYGEIYERNLGKDSPLKIERGKNRMIEDGGLITWQPFL